MINGVIMVIVVTAEQVTNLVNRLTNLVKNAEFPDDVYYLDTDKLINYLKGSTNEI